MRYHDDETVFCGGFQQFHDLNTGFAVQGAGGFIGKYDFGVIYQCTGNGNTLHLSTGKLVGAFCEVLSQTDSFQRSGCPCFPFCPGNARDGKGHLHI